jgi:hypothetical protein
MQPDASECSRARESGRQAEKREAKKNAAEAALRFGDILR